MANALARLDVGQSVAVCERACVAVEAMEGTDAMLRRAASLANGRPLRLVKVSAAAAAPAVRCARGRAGTIRTMAESGATVLAVDAGRTLLLDRDEMLRLAADADIAIVGCRPEPDPGENSEKAQGQA